MDQVEALLEQYRQLRDASKGRVRDVLAALKRVEPFLPEVVAEGTHTDTVLIGIAAIEDKKTWFGRPLTDKDLSALKAASTEPDEIGVRAREALVAISRHSRSEQEFSTPALAQA